MACEMCGREGVLYKTLIEGTELSLCEKCGKFGKVLQPVRTFEAPKLKRQIQKTEVVEVLVSDFSQKIKSAREKLGLTQKDFAKRINEKESIMHNLETGHYTPTIDVAKRYEKILNILLVETVTQELEEPVKKSKGTVLTIGDMIKIK